MKITHVLLNNGQLGKITKEQRAGECDVWQTSLHNPGFRPVRRNVRRHRGARGPSGGTRGCLAAAIAHDGPALVEVIADPELV